MKYNFSFFVLFFFFTFFFFVFFLHCNRYGILSFLYQFPSFRFSLLYLLSRASITFSILRPLTSNSHRPRFRHTSLTGTWTNRPLSWFVQLLKTPATQLSLRQADKKIYQTHSLPNPFTFKMTGSFETIFFATSFSSLLLGCLGIYISVQLYWILIGALKSYRQYDRLRKNCLNNSIDKILLVLINYFWQPYFWFWGRAGPSWRTSFPLWIFSPTQVQSSV